MSIETQRTPIHKRPWAEQRTIAEAVLHKEYALIGPRGMYDVYEISGDGTLPFSSTRAYVPRFADQAWVTIEGQNPDGRSFFHRRDATVGFLQRESHKPSARERAFRQLAAEHAVLADLFRPYVLPRTHFVVGDVTMLSTPIPQVFGQEEGDSLLFALAEGVVLEPLQLPVRSLEQAKKAQIAAFLEGVGRVAAERRHIIWPVELFQPGAFGFSSSGELIVDVDRLHPVGKTDSEEIEAKRCLEFLYDNLS